MSRACVIAILLAACGGDDEAIVAVPPPPPPARHVERARSAPKLPVVVAVVEDGVAADEDHCPDIPDELEGTDYKSSDPKPVAAPEVDRDSDDAIPDVEDRCPDVPDPSSDDDGCPG
jgi:hypothetical protein